MDFSTIDQDRIAAGITQKALCARADVHPTTYSRAKKGAVGGQVRTLQKLATALDALIHEKERAA
ncbi:helix-turn-helix transcriptional regulator [uncultured Nitratireductor sp.]|uniref:helix-turn-helix domain-containing protein n=1 Tax=uncultured Nitratireductor sp. TaxID=520953 RepID=UPI00345803B6